MIDATQATRDKAIVAVLYEPSCRAGKFLSIKIRSVQFDRYCAVILVHSKTSCRRIRLVSQVPYLAELMNMPPFNDNPKAWLQISLRNFKRLSYNLLRTILRVIAEKVGVRKSVNPHAFRHTRATHPVNFLTEVQIKEFFGWVQDSDTASVYVHLSGRDVDKAVLNLYGIEMKESNRNSELLKSKKCLRCDEMNPTTNRVYQRCFFLLDRQKSCLKERLKSR